MIPVTLTLKGIYSYQDKTQTIDFIKLSSSGLFGIFGSVGSGKSTILEAISFALYGETERLNSRENRSYNMMNLKSDQMLIDFIFLNATDQTKYRFIVKANRTKKRHEDVKPIERTAFKLLKDEWIPIPVKSAEEITGLSYINFRRTVIIPQGKFQEFLQLGDTDRSKMMKELFHLERFDLWGKTKALEDRNEAAIQLISGQLMQLADVSEEKLRFLESEIEKEKVSLNELQLKQNELGSQIEEQKSIKELFKKLADEEKQFDEIKKQSPAIEQLKSELNEYIRCSSKFAASIGKLGELKTKHQTVLKNLEQLQSEFRSIELKYNELEPVFAKLKIPYENRDQLKRDADDLHKLLEIKKLDDELEKLKLRYEKGQGETLKLLEIIKKHEEDREILKAAGIKIKSEQSDMAELANIKAWFVQLAALKKEQIGLNLEIESIENQIKVSDSRLAEQIKKQVAVKDIKTDDIKETLAQQIKIQENELEAVENELKHLKIKEGLRSYSEQLVDGEACPVCGSKHHPEKMEAAGLTELIKQIEKQLVEKKTGLKKLNDFDRELGKVLAELELLKTRACETTEKRLNCIQQIENHQNNYMFSQKFDEKQLAETFELAARQKSEMEQIDSELHVLENALNSELKKKEKYAALLLEISNDINSKTASYETLSKQLGEEILSTYKNEDEPKLKTHIQKLNSDYQKLVTDYLKVEKQLAQLKPEKDKLSGSIETKKKDLESLEHELYEHNAGLTGLLADEKYQSLSEIEKILARAFDLELETKRINAFEQKQYTVIQHIESLKLQIGQNTFNETEYNLKCAEYDHLTGMLTNANKKLGSLEKEKTDQMANLMNKNKLILELNQVNERAENIRTLKNLFKGSGFVNYISSVYLQNLLNSANQRFQPLTGQKLRLELTENNDFIIRDFLNEGKTRSVKTLSGGQTFQASLSLALALADNIQALNKSGDNFFFLDEGFGSLDKESLSTVFASLKSLRKENRIVGIISHVEDLQQEIDNYLKIENTSLGGSLISNSWE